jgi:serine protease Do
MKALLFLILLMTTGLQAQIRSPKIPAADRETTDAQSDAIFKALRAVNFAAKEVVYPIYAGRERVAYGIAIGDGKLLTKASEVLAGQALFTANREKVALVAKVVGTYPEYDLAVLKVPGLTAEAARWGDAETLEEGAFLAAVRSDGEAQAMGVLSVKERSLKTLDQGFLGIQMDIAEAGAGVRVQAVVRGSAAEEVGIRAGDIITIIEGENVRGFYELSTRLRRLERGGQPEIEFLRANKTFKVKPTLKGREIDEGASRRLERMDRMSGTQSRVRGDFGNVIQSDMELESKDAGLPVVDLEGRIVGMVIARAGRISTLILPGDDIAKVLERAPQPFVGDPRAVRQSERVGRGGDLRQRLWEGLQRGLEGESGE